MIAPATDVVVSGTADQDGRLIAADPPLEQLQIRAGGAIGGPIALPGIASIVRLARTLGIVVSRRIIIGGDGAHTKVWVRAEPGGGEVRLRFADWERVAPDAAGPHEPVDLQILAELESHGNWACDAGLRVTRFDGAPVALPETVLTRWLRFLPGDDGEMPILEALALRTGFADQSAELRSEAATRLILQGAPVFDDAGFAGFAGTIRYLDAPIAPLTSATDREALDGFGERLHGALRAPIMRIVANADMIASRTEAPISDDYAGYASDIALASRHLLGLADDLRDLHLIESSAYSAETMPIELGDVARRAAGLLGVRASNKRVKLDVPAADENVVAIGDFKRVLQIIANLTGNAVRHSPDGSSVWVRLEEERDLVAIVVADQGPGIAKDDQERIFEKFERLNPADGAGSGLGLYISRRLARAMGGDLTVDSAPGQGARFVLTLPRDPDSA